LMRFVFPLAGAPVVKRQNWSTVIISLKFILLYYIYILYINYEELSFHQKPTPKKRIIRGLTHHNDSHHYEGKQIIPVDDMQAVLNLVYTNPLTGYKSINSFYDYIKDKYIGIMI